MRCVFFSDLHIKASGDTASKLFQKLCDSAEVKDATHIFLLGDIFDLLIGEHKEYFQKYSEFFDRVIELLDAGKSVVYLEGNHDFHLKKSFEKFIQTNSQNPNKFQYLTAGMRFTLDGKSYYICHGDEVDDENESFKKWKNIYTSKEFAFLVNRILPFKFIDFLGSKVSQNSKNRGRKSFNLEALQTRYRDGAARLIKSKAVDGIICGHTHIQEQYEVESGKTYFNCGHPLSDHNFLYFNGTNFNFISLKDS